MMVSVVHSLLFAVLHTITFGQVYTSKPEKVPTNESSSAAASNASPLASEIAKGAKAKWIWGSKQSDNYILSTKFAVNKPTAGWLRASGDNAVSLRINGKEIGSSDEWESPLDVDIQKYLVDGDNSIEANVSNAGGAAGFVCKLIVQQTDGTRVEVLSGSDWLASNGNSASVAATTVATYGDAPWKNVFDDVRVDSNRDVFRVQPGFEIERLFKVPRNELGSWVCIAMDNKGRILASDQGNQGLFRITPSQIGSTEPTKIEKLKIDISAAQGMLYAFDSLYVSVNGDHSALYRLRDTDGDDQFDEKTLLKKFRGGGEHGPHAIRLSPDGKSIVLVAGNHTLPPSDRTTKEPIQGMGGARAGQLHASLPADLTSRIAPNWDEDVLPARQWDANGHATGIYAPGGWIAQTDPEGKAWEILSIGYRNQYDFDINADGEMFVYDSDMEWDMGTSWYRPTRVMHATSGSEFGWRSGTACWPTNYPDSVPSLSDIGPGSPVGVTFGYGSKFPAKYQKALFLCDWTFGTMYAIHMEPNGSTYTATKEEFLSRTPLPLTDAIVGQDGAMYFTVGGRGTQSELYRVTYTGKESTARIDYHDTKGKELRKIRHDLESLHHAYQADKVSKDQLNQLLSGLGHDDAAIRYAARVAIERIPVQKWASLALAANKPNGIIEAAMGVARSGEHENQTAVLSALNGLDWSTLSEGQRIAYLRAIELVLIRLGSPNEAERNTLIQRLEAIFENASEPAKRELAILLVHLDAASAPSRIVPLLSKESKVDKLSTEELLARNRGYGSSIAAMLSNQPDLQKVHYAFVLREQRSGWTLDLRKAYFAWFAKAQKWSGGNSYQKFLTNISNDAFKAASDQDRLAMEALGLRTPTPVPKELPKPTGPGRDYTVEELVQISQKDMKGRDFQNGKKMYAAARCVVCHRFAGEGGSTGPDLTQAAGRFATKDLIEAIIEPSKVISDQYKTMIVTTDDGDSFSGRIVSDTESTLVLVTDPEDSSKTVQIKKSDITGSKSSTESVMPRSLLKELNDKEVLDLLAYLLARGNENDPVFKR
jgi:putative heme-binding domain-containing protein